MVESRTAAECKARYRKLCKEVKARKEMEHLSRGQQLGGKEDGSEAGPSHEVAEVLLAKEVRVAQLQVARTAAIVDDASKSVVGQRAAIVGDNDASKSAASEESTSGELVCKGDAPEDKPTKKLKPSERRALKKAEKAARQEAKARQRSAAVKATDDSSSDGEATGRTFRSKSTEGGGLGWGVIEL